MLTSADKQALGKQSLTKGMILLSAFISFPGSETRTTLRKYVDFSKAGKVVSFLKRGIAQRNLEGVQTSKEMLVVSTNKN